MKEDLLVPFVGAIATALIAALVSLVIVILSKDQKTSEFRQAWIDGLREDVSKFVGAAEAFYMAIEIVREKSRTDAHDFFMSKYSELAETEFLLSKIRLRLNPKEHVGLLEVIKWLRDESVEKTRAEVVEHVEFLVVGVQMVLKDEWERVKVGERSFRILKYTSGAVVASIIAAVVGYFIVSKIIVHV